MVRRSRISEILVLVAVCAAAYGCEETVIDPPPTPLDLQMTPRTVVLFVGDSMRLVATRDSSPATFLWHVADGPGSVSSTGVFKAPRSIPTDSVRARVVATTEVGPAAAGAVHITILADSSQRICFKRDVRPIILAHCAVAGCHDPGGREQGYDFTQDFFVGKVVTPGEPQRSLMYSMITHNEQSERMPPYPREPLNKESIALIARWIMQGAMLDGCKAAACDTSDIRYTITIRSILLANCITCHDGATPVNGNVDLSTYSAVKSVAESGQLLGSVTHAPGYAPMPTDSSRLEECDLVRIEAWINAGAPNN